MTPDTKHIRRPIAEGFTPNHRREENVGFPAFERDSDRFRYQLKRTKP